MGKYNLIDEKWINVVDLSGDRRKLGIKDILLQASTIAYIDDESPFVVAAVHRLLLAILYKAINGPTDIDQAVELVQVGLPKDKIEAYLQIWYNRFYLFDEEYPFYQISDKDLKKETPWTVLYAERSSGHNKLLFDHTNNSTCGSISYDKAARGLLAIQTFALGGGKSPDKLPNRANAPSGSARLCFPQGKNLEHTLLICLVPENSEILEDDIPIWEQGAKNIAQLKKAICTITVKEKGKYKNKEVVVKSFTGISNYYTWFSRAIQFKDNEKDSTMSYLYFAGGESLYDENNKRCDPMASYYQSKDNGINSTKIKGTKSFWRDFSSLFVSNDRKSLGNALIDYNFELKCRDTAALVNILVVGQCNNKAKVDFYTINQYNFPISVEKNSFRKDLTWLLKQSEIVGKKLHNATEIYSTYILQKNWDGICKLSKEVNEHIELFSLSLPVKKFYWSEMELAFHQMLALVNKTGSFDEEVEIFWGKAIKRISEQAWNLHVKTTHLDGTTIKALVIAETLLK